MPCSHHPSRSLSPQVLCLVLLIPVIMSIVACPARGGKAASNTSYETLTLGEVRDLIEQKGYSWRAGRTSLSDLPPEEFTRRMGLRLPQNYDEILRRVRSRPPLLPALDLPSRFDWSDSISMPPIREQLCGDCWAQAVTAGMECQVRFHDHDSTALAVQNVIDCNFGSSNCAGGFLWDACFLFANVGGVAGDCYPYVGADMNCSPDTCPLIGKLDAFDDIDTTVVSIKTHLITYGPIPVALGVPPDLQYYTGGCYESDLPWDHWHAMLIIGWEDSMCGGYGAWHCWNCSGTEWGEDGYAWIKYHTAKIGADAKVLHYTSRGSVQLGIEAFTIDDSAGDADSVPDPGETVGLAIELSNSAWTAATGISAVLTSTTPGVNVIDGSAVFPDIDPDSTGWSVLPHFSFSVDTDMLCGRPAGLLLSLSCNEGVCTDELEILIGEAGVVFFDDGEVDLGWDKRAADDEATSGVWRRRDPVGSATDTCLVQPERDHTPGSASKCFVTSNVLRKLDPNSGDVDGGKTTLTSPVTDLSGRALATLRYWRWYTNDTGGNVDDAWAVDVSPDSGVTWVNLETTAEGERAWVRKEFDLGTTVALTDKVLVRFVASDYGYDSTVEAAVDDVEIVGSPWWVDDEGPAVKVLSPDGGEEITEETQHLIQWSAGDDYGVRKAAVLVSYDGGATFPDTLGAPLWPDTTLLWDVPAGEYPECILRVEVTDRGYSQAADESDSAFAIVRDLSGLPGERASHDPEAVELLGSERNPFTATTRIFFAVPAPGEARLAIYNVEGRPVRHLLRDRLEAGYHSAVWDGKSDAGEPTASGVYFIHLSASGRSHTAKIVLRR